MFGKEKPKRSLVLQNCVDTPLHIMKLRNQLALKKEKRKCLIKLIRKKTRRVETLIFFNFFKITKKIIHFKYMLSKTHGYS